MNIDWKPWLVSLSLILLFITKSQWWYNNTIDISPELNTSNNRINKYNLNHAIQPKWGLNFHPIHPYARRLRMYILVRKWDWVMNLFKLVQTVHEQTFLRSTCHWTQMLDLSKSCTFGSMAVVKLWDVKRKLLKKYQNNPAIFLFGTSMALPPIKLKVKTLF